MTTEEKHIYRAFLDLVDTNLVEEEMFYRVLDKVIRYKRKRIKPPHELPLVKHASWFQQKAVEQMLYFYDNAETIVQTVSKDNLSWDTIRFLVEYYDYESWMMWLIVLKMSHLR